MDKDQLKLAFLKVKHDIMALNDEISSIKYEISSLRSLLGEINEKLVSKDNFLPSNPNIGPFSTDPYKNPSLNANPTDSQTVPQEIGGLISQKTSISTGNEGVSTNQQTNHQILNQTQNIKISSLNSTLQESSNINNTGIESKINEASKIFDSLDKIKKEIKDKFKKLTSQEMVIFSTIYQLEEENPEKTSYKDISQRLSLSESSIRDYVQRLLIKGIPIKKQKINNKLVLLSISPDLKRIVTLSTIIKLREL